MRLEPLNTSIKNTNNPKIISAFNRLNDLLKAIEEKDIPSEQIQSVNNLIIKQNSFKGNDKKLRTQLHKTDCSIIALLEKELKYVPKNYYTTMWTALGMSVFGLPMGVVFSSLLKNYAFISIGLPIGLAIGLVYGKKLDEKAALNNLQLNLRR